MLLVTLAFEKERDNIIQDISNLKELYKDHNAAIGFSESMTGNTHFIKVFCDDDIESRLMRRVDLYLADILYRAAADEFIKKYMEPLLADSCFFLRNDELTEIESQCLYVLKCDEKQLNHNNICCYNRKNYVVEKIIKLIKENREINIDGFINFRMRELNCDFTYILNRIVEGYMVEREYDEFIKLMRYFVELQESKVEEVNIIIDEMGEYSYRDNKNKDIKKILSSEIFDFRHDNSDDDDMLISILIANSPKKIIIHCVENAISQEIIDTIVKVFSDRVEFCSHCRMCRHVKEILSKPIRPRRK